MRITRFLDHQGQLHHGRDLGDGTADVLADSPLLRPPKPTGAIVTIAQRLAPVDPANILCIGANYLAHCEEGGGSAPPRPVLFMKPTTALQHPGEPIRLPACELDGPEVDYEGELVVVIGTEGRDIAEADALDHVLGYTASCDVSARHWQKYGCNGQFVRGKGFDTFCPLGPVLVTSEDIPDPQTLRLVTKINGQVMQDSCTSDMIFPVAHLIAFLSQDTMLLPGTVILTGTPSGVGASRDPQVFLKAGDQVEVTIDKIGALSNPVVGS